MIGDSLGVAASLHLRANKRKRPNVNYSKARASSRGDDYVSRAARDFSTLLRVITRGWGTRDRGDALSPENSSFTIRAGR
jgi:hypothetical protein